jgi:hypothetical protein
MSSDNMIRTNLLDGTPVTVWFNRPNLDTHESTVKWMGDVRLEAATGLPAVSPDEIESLLRFVLDEWAFSQEEAAFMRSCPCGESHIV